jgi:hypothetical protein
MVVDVRPWNGRLCLNLWSWIFFPFKNCPSQSCGLYSRASIDVKTGSPGLADFGKNRPLIHLHIALWRPQYANSRHTTDMPTDTQPLCELPEPQKWTINFWQFAQNTKWRLLAIHTMVVQPLAYYGRYPICHSRGSRCQGVAKSAGSRESVFTLHWWTLWTISVSL